MLKTLPIPKIVVRLLIWNKRKNCLEHKKLSDIFTKTIIYYSN